MGKATGRVSNRKYYKRLTLGGWAREAGEGRAVFTHIVTARTDTVSDLWPLYRLEANHCCIRCY